MSHDSEIVLFRRELLEITEYSIFKDAQSTPSLFAHRIVDPITLQAGNNSSQRLEVAQLVAML